MSAALLGALAAPGARAEGPSAAELERGARQAYERHAYAAAARGFEAAYRATPHPAMKFNAALAWDQAGDPARAADAYEAALGGEGLAPEQGRIAEARLAKLNHDLGTAILDGPAGAVVWIDNDVEAKLPTRLHLAPGDHTAAIAQPGAAATSMRFSVRAGAATPVTIAALPAPQERPQATPSPAPEASAPRPDASPVPSPARTFGFVSLGGAGAFTGAAIALGVATLNTRDAYVNAGSTDAGAHDRAVTLRALTNVAWGLAAASGALGVGLLIASGGGASPSAPKPARAEIFLGPNRAALRLSF